MGGGKKKPGDPPDLDNAAVRGTVTQWHGQEQYAEELTKEGYQKVYAKPSKPDPAPGPPSAKVMAKNAKRQKGPGPVKIPEKDIPKVVPRGTTGYDADEFGKELKRIYPTGGPDIVAVDHKRKKILVGDITARSSSTGTIDEGGTQRRLPNDLEDEDFTRHHLDKTKRDAERLSANLSDNYKGYDIEFEDRYVEDLDRKKSRRFKVIRKKPPAPAGAAVGKPMTGGKPTDDDRGTKKKDPLRDGAKRADAKVRADANGKAAKPGARKPAAKAKFDADAKAARLEKIKAVDAARKRAAAAAAKKAADDAKAKAAKDASEKAAEAAKRRAAEEAKRKAAEEAKKKAAEAAKKKAADDAKAKAADAAKRNAAEEARKRAVKEAEEQAAKTALKEAEEKAAKSAIQEAERKAAADAAAKVARKTPSKLSLKIRPKIKAGVFFLLEIGFDLFLGWMDSNRVEGMIKAEISKNEDKLQKVLDSDKAQDDFIKFRTGEKLEKGYQLYLYMRLYVNRHCSDGGCGTSGSIVNVSFMDVTFDRSKGREFFPDAQEEKGWGAEWNGLYGGAIATFNIALFDKGDNIEGGTEDAADDRHDYFIKRFIDRTEDRGTGDYTREYFDAYRKYALMFPDSQSNRVYNLKFGLNEVLADLAMVELARKPATVLLSPPANMQFHEIIEKVKWGLAGKLLFIVDFYKIITESGYDRDTQIYYLEKYDKYFRQIDDGYTKCQVSCHKMNADKRLIHRKTADDLREEKEFEERMKSWSRGTYIKPLDRGITRK